MQDLADRCATIKATVRLRLCREILRRSVLSRRLDAARKARQVRVHLRQLRVLRGSLRNEYARSMLRHQGIRSAGRAAG